MSTPGFFTVQRDLRDDAVLHDSIKAPISTYEAWLWIGEKAAYAERKFSVSGKSVTVQRGQLCTSIRHLAKEFRWDEKRVRRFLTRLESAAWVVLSDAAGQTLVTICNYDEKFGCINVRAAVVTADAPQERLTNAAQENQVNQGKEGKREESLSCAVPPISMVANTSATVGRNTDAGAAPEREPGLPFGGQSEPKQASEKAVAPEIDEAFNRFWGAYPKRQGANPKQQAKAVFVRLVRGGTNGDVIVHAAERYAKEVQSEGKLGTQWVAHASTWLNQKRWSDYTADNVHTGNFGEGQSAEPEWKTNPNAWRHDYAPPWPDAPKNTRCGRWIKGSVNWARAL